MTRQRLIRGSGNGHRFLTQRPPSRVLPAEPALGPRAAAGPGPHTERAPRYLSEGTVPMRQALLGTPRASFSPSGYAPLLPLKIEGSCFYFSSLGSSKRVALIFGSLCFSDEHRPASARETGEKQRRHAHRTPLRPYLPRPRPALSPLQRGPGSAV